MDRQPDYRQLAARGKAAQAQRKAEGRPAGRVLFVESALGYDTRSAAQAQPKAVHHGPQDTVAPGKRSRRGAQGRALDVGPAPGRVAARWGTKYGSGQDRAIEHEERE
jgi:hypothetical protein